MVPRQPWCPATRGEGQPATCGRSTGHTARRNERGATRDGRAIDCRSRRAKVSKGRVSQGVCCLFVVVVCGGGCGGGDVAVECCRGRFLGRSLHVSN